MGNLCCSARDIPKAGKVPGDNTKPAEKATAFAAPAKPARAKDALGKIAGSPGMCLPAGECSRYLFRKMRVAGLRCARLGFRGTSLIRNTPTVGPYSSPMPMDLW